MKNLDEAMCTNYATWIGLFIIAALVTLAAKYYPYFPGGVAVERWVQSWVPQNLNRAIGISRTAEFPWVLLRCISVAEWVASPGGNLWLEYVVSNVIIYSTLQ